MNDTIGIIGLGYVGLPLAIEFAKKYSVVGYDTDKSRIEELITGFDRTNEIEKNEILNKDKLKLSCDVKVLNDVDIYIVTVPTPVDCNNKPDLSYIKIASKVVGGLLKKNNTVIFESTVYPGCTEQICLPILERESALHGNKDFFYGYSPERINPGDKKHTLTKVKKVVSGSNVKALDIISKLYSSIIEAGVHKAASIAVAEAAKVIENTQRDVNIALMNELAIIFNKLNINTRDVLNAASTKWNFINFKPGLVGGHCIGVDPYYLTHKALEIGYHPEIILNGRKINDSMGDYIAEKTISSLINTGVNPIGAKVAVFGLTFKENCPDLRNTKVLDLIKKLKEYQCDVIVTDYWAYKKEVNKICKFDLVPQRDIKQQDAIVLAVSHDQYRDIKKEEWVKLIKTGGVVFDIKSMYKKSFFDKFGLNYWSL